MVQQCVFGRAAAPGEPEHLIADGHVGHAIADLVDHAGDLMVVTAKRRRGSPARARTRRAQDARYPRMRTAGLARTVVARPAVAVAVSLTASRWRRSARRTR